MSNGHVYEPTSQWVPATGETDGSQLPTPVVNDMGAGKTVEKWDSWTAEMKAKHGNSNGHGPSLSIEVRKLLPTPLTTDWNTPWHTDGQLRSIERLLPTPTAQDGANNAGPSQWNRNTDPLNVVAAKLSGATMPPPSPDGSSPADDPPPPQ